MATRYDYSDLKINGTSPTAVYLNKDGSQTQIFRLKIGNNDYIHKYNSQTYTDTVTISVTFKTNQISDSDNSLTSLYSTITFSAPSGLTIGNYWTNNWNSFVLSNQHGTWDLLNNSGPNIYSCNVSKSSFTLDLYSEYIAYNAFNINARIEVYGNHNGHYHNFNFNVTGQLTTGLGYNQSKSFSQNDSVQYTVETKEY